MKIYVEFPYILILIIPVIILLIILMRKNFIKFNTKQEQREYEKLHKKRRIFIIISRCFIALWLLIALSSPYTLKEEFLKGDYSLKILVDNSTSMLLYDTSVVNDIFSDIKDKIPVTKKPIMSGESSPIGNAIINNMHGNDNILLVTDGQTTNGKELADVMFFANLLNTTINAVNLEALYDDYSVVIEGPSEAITGTNSEFYIRVNKAGNPPGYNVHATIDDIPVNTEMVEPDLYKFSKTMSEGYHKIKAKIVCSDFFQENNIYYKTLHVLPKPSVLYITEKDPLLLKLLKPIYTIEQKAGLPEKTNNYAAIILDDIDIDKLEPKTEKISDYIIEGGGLFVIGGENSFDRGLYQGSMFETILPVKVGEAGKGGELATNVVIVIDISESTGQDFSTRSSTSKVDVEKALALEILKGISYYDKIGVVAFNHRAYVLSKLVPLAESEEIISQKIASLHDTGGTFVYSGLKKAEYLMDGSLGSKNIILISDGVDSVPSLSIDLAKQFAKKNIKLFTVGVGESTNNAFLQTLAVETGGQYFEPDETQKLKILFGEREEMPAQDVKSLVLFNNKHFITSGLDVIADITGYNQVVKKSSAQMLVSMGDGKPIMTVWRYGLGRVVALSTDDGEKWSSMLLSQQNSKLLMRALNWAIGDPQKNLPFYIKVKDIYLGDTAKIIVKSDSIPTSNILEFEKTDENMYTAYYTPNKAGYQHFFKAIVAVNSPKEYEKTGINEELRDLVEITGGKMFNSKDTDGLIDFIKTVSLRKKTIPSYIRWPFILIALIILLTEIFVRKILESVRREK